MKQFSALLAALLFGFVALAEPADPPMTKIVMRFVSAKIDPDSFAAKPKTLFLAGETYARIEEEPDPARGLHGLIVVHEPDIWIINLLDHSGRHQVDPGPSLVVHNPILPPGGPKEFAALEFGKEIDFFRRHKASPAAAREIDGTRCQAMAYTYGDYKLVLFTAADTDVPFQLEVYRDEKLNASVRYLSYERDLPFNPGLFKPPAEIKLIEAPRK
jgi:hypothetical protein